MLSRAIYKKQRGRRLVTALAAAGLVAGTLLATSAVLAVHATGLFELDGNAANGAAAGDDWDNVCHQVVGSDCSTSSNTTGADAVSWVSEPNLNSTIFTGGGSKDPQDISSWAWKDGAGGLPDKDNLLHSYAARYTTPSSPECAAKNPNGTPNTDGTLPCSVLYFGSDRYDNSGDAQQGFWFFQNAVGLGSNSVGGGTGFTGVHKNGDLLVISDFSNGGTTSTITVYSWDTTCTKTTGSTAGACGDANLRILGTSTSANCGSAASTDGFCGLVNAGTITMPWSFTDKSGTANNGALNGEFYEGGVNLSALGLGGECFASVASETRSSTSTTATLKDFVLGGFGKCTATLTTAASTNGTVTPGTSVTDTATVVGSSAAHTPSGSVEFYLCGPGVTTCDSTGTDIGSGTLSGSGTTATATSPAVNGSGSELAAGTYCFAAVWQGDSNYTDKPYTDDGVNECFTVAKINTTTVTTPSTTSVTLASIIAGGFVTDTAVVTGNATGGDPTGTVSFFICGVNTGVCTTGGTAVSGNPVTLVSDGNASTYTSSATSGHVGSSIITAVGTYCFRGDYSGSSIYNTSSDSASSECFTVTDGTSMTSAQSWVPNDSATVTAAGGSPLSGTLSIQMYVGSTTCAAGTESGSPYTKTLTDASSAADRTLTTTNSTAFTADTDISWKVSFTSSNSNIGNSSHCETSSLTVTN